MSQGEAAEYAGISIRTLHKWKLDGLPFSAVGGTVRIHRDDLDKYIRGHRARTIARRHGAVA